MRLLVGLSILVSALVPAATASVYAAETFYVANNGVDSSTCGPSDNPCRSITNAIANAASGDKIVVGPGLYGDLNGNGILGETGEETPGSCSARSMLGIDKAVTLTSSDGAAATIIDAHATALSATVSICAGGVAFGEPAYGFTVTNTAIPHGDADAGTGLMILYGDVSVRGNQIVHRETVFSSTEAVGIDVSRHLGTVAIEDNQVIGWDVGIDASSETTISRNAVQLNRIGIAAQASTVTGNVATGNALGISVSSAASVIGNAVVGNSDSGIQVLDLTDTVEGNNIFGNTCGLFAPTTSGVVATNNFWGAATGPGADPADDVCGFGATTTPFAEKPFRVKITIKP